MVGMTRNSRLLNYNDGCPCCSYDTQSKRARSRARRAAKRIVMKAVKRREKQIWRQDAGF